LRKRKHQVFYFLFYHDVPHHNNGSYYNFFIIPTSAINDTFSKICV
jgi:hypothetical protein